MPKEVADARLSDGVGFVSVNPNFSDSSAQLMDFVRATLKHAQEITATVDQAEQTADLALRCTNSVELDREWMEQEVARLQSILGIKPPPVEGTPVAKSVPPQASKTGDAPKEAAATAPPDATPGLPEGVTLSAGAGEPIADQMAKEIQITVMWVQQLLELVHVVESGEKVEAGKSLIDMVRPGALRTKKDALAQSLGLFREKKEDDEEFDSRAQVFRNQAMSAVMANRAGSRGNPAV